MHVIIKQESDKKGQYMMENTIGRNILMCFILVIMGAVAGTALLVLVFIIPVDENKAQESFDIIMGEASYPAIPIVGDLTGMNLQSIYPGVLDNCTDEIMIFTALDIIRTDKSALYRSMSMYNGYFGREYSYYWHGYVSVLRPLLCIFSYDELRFLNGLMQMLLIFGLVIKVWQKKGGIYGLIMFTSYALLMPIALMFSLQFTWVFYIAMLAALLLICKGEWAVEKQRYIFVFCVVGMLTSYFDLLTYPVFTWGIPVLWWIMMREPEGNGVQRIVEVIVSGISWVLGYGMLWVMKWFLGSFALRQNIIREAVNEVFLRSGMEEKLSVTERFGAAYVNWEHYGYFIYVLILLTWLIWGLARGLRKGWNIHYNIFAYCLVGVSSVVWYYVLANHTLAHHFFTYRIFNVSILAFLAIWAGAFGVDSGRGSVQKDWQVRFLAIMLIGIGSVGSAFMAREGIWANNGYVTNHLVQLSDQDVMSMEFRPTFSRINEVGICVIASKKSGLIEVTVLDGEQVIYQESSSIENWGEEAYHALPVKWKLEAGKRYILQIRLLGNDEAVAILVTDEGNLPMNEYGTLWVNEEAIEGQIVSGVTYWHYPTSRKTQLFLIFTWMGILSCLALALYTLYDIAKEKYHTKDQ